MEDELIGKYRILRSIGAGGMATVFLAAHCDVPNLKTVLKKLTDPQLADRFKREADKLALLDGHPGVCQIKHFFEHKGDFYIVMEYIDGPTLDQLIKSDDPPDLARVLEIGCAILATLAYAHQLGIVHRDIKPSNIMIDRVGQVKIIDFGVAKGAADPDLTQVGTSLGSPRYMAPEQFSPDASIDWVRCDLYSVGITLYYLLTGAVPFQGADIYEMRDAKRRGDVPPPSHLNPAIPPAVDAVVMKAMACNPRARYGSATEMRADLRLAGVDDCTPDAVGIDHTMVLGNDRPAPTTAPMSVQAGHTTASVGYGTPTPAPKPVAAQPAKNRRPIFILAAAIFVAGLLGTVGLLSLRHTGESKPSGVTQNPLLSVAPSLLAPAMGSTVADARVAFRWGAASDSLAVFTLQYGTDPSLTAATHSTEQTGGRRRLESPLVAGVYYWRVRFGAQDSPTGPWSTVASFTVAAPLVKSRPAPQKDQTPKAKKPPRPRPTVAKFEIRIAVRRDNVSVMDDAVIEVDGQRRDFYFPGTVDLTSGEHRITAVYMYGGREWKATRNITVSANSERTLVLDLEKPK